VTSRSASIPIVVAAESMSFVTDPDLLGRDRVVLVDDRNDAPLEQRLDRVPEVREPPARRSCWVSSSWATFRS